MAWIDLFIAGALEIIWATSLKSANGFTVLIPSVIAVAGMIMSFIFLSLATRELPTGTSYAIWTGIGAIGTVMTGIIIFNEPFNISRLIFLLLIIAGIIGLKISA